MATEPLQREDQQIAYREPVLNALTYELADTDEDVYQVLANLALEYGPMNFPPDSDCNISSMPHWVESWEHGLRLDVPGDGMLLEKTDDWLLFLRGVADVAAVIDDLNAWRENPTVDEPESVIKAWFRLTGEETGRESRPDFVASCLSNMHYVSGHRTIVRWHRGAFRAGELSEGLVGLLGNELLHRACGLRYPRRCAQCGRATDRPITRKRRIVLCESEQCALEHRRAVSRERKRRQRHREKLADNR